MQPVPIAGTVQSAYGSVFGQLGLLARAAFLPYLLSLVLMFGGNPFLNPLILLLSLIPQTIFAIAWHRLVLLGPQRASPAFFPGWSRRHWRFVGNTLMLLVITSAVTTVASLATLLFLQDGGAEPTAGTATLQLLEEGGTEQAALLRAMVTAAIFAIPPVVYITLRFAFVFPAIAVDEAYRLRDAWRHTRGQGARLMLVMFLTLAPMICLQILIIYGLMADFVGNEIGYVLNNLLGYIVLALCLSVISSAFRACTGWIPAESAQGLQATSGEGDKPEA